jgi:hypothetical protein
MPYLLKTYNLPLEPSLVNKDCLAPHKPNPGQLPNNLQQKTRICYQSRFIETEPSQRLALADTEKLGAADRANALDGRPLVLQNDRFRVFNLPLGPAFHAICLSHDHTSNITLA